MKLGMVTKINKKNKITSKKVDDDVMWENSDIIVIFAIYGKSEEIWKPDSRRIACKTYILIKK